jgi:hypothetical protein
MAAELLLREFNTLPANLQAQVLDFVLFLKKTKPAQVKRKPSKRRNAPKAGFGKYKVVMRPDFDAPLDIFRDYMP